MNPKLRSRAIPRCCFTGLILLTTSNIAAEDTVTHVESASAGIAAPASKADTTDAHALLVEADAIRNPGRDFQQTIALSEYRANALKDSSAVSVYVKASRDTGQTMNLVRFVSPKREIGKLLLRNGADIWFYDPATKASVRLSPQARLLGQASVGDVMSASLSKAYAAKIVAHEVTEDDEKKPRKCVKLHLVAQRSDVAYAQIDYWIEEGTNKPIKAQFFTEEGRLLKSAFFRRYQDTLGRSRPTETVIIDGLDNTWITVVRQTDLRPKEVPQSWFQRGLLPHINWDE